MSVTCPGTCGNSFNKKHDLGRHLMAVRKNVCGAAVIDLKCCGEKFLYGYELGQHLITAKTKTKLKDHDFYQTQLLDEVSKV